MENIFSKTIKYGLYAILLVPLAFWPRALYAFLTPKFLLFQILVEIIFSAWLILLIYKGKFAQFIRSLRKNYIAIALIAFAAVSFISAIFGVDFSRSFWGIGARMTGLFAELHFLAWFLMLSSFLYSAHKTDGSNSGDSDRLINSNYYLNFSFAVSIAVALTAFYANLEWRLVPGYTIFSNPTFVAPYFLFHFFWGLYRVWKSRPFNKLFFGAGSVLILTALLLGEIRGSIIGLIAGILFLGIGLALSGIASWRSLTVIAVFCLLFFLSVITFWYWRDASFIQNIGFLKKFSEISITATTTQTRILLWRASLKIFADRPLLGMGPENFNYLFNAHYDPRFLKYGGGSFAETWQDKPHNGFLEALAEVGIIGVLAYAAIWFAAAFYLFKMFKNGWKPLALVLGSAFVSYLGAIFFSFDSFGSWFGLYLMLGFLASRNRDANMQMHANGASNTDKYRPKTFALSASLPLIAILASFLYLNYAILQANLADADALRIFSRDPARGIALFKKSLSYYTPYKTEYQFDLIASVIGAIGRGMPLPNLEDAINLSLDEADKAVAAHPKDAAKYTDMAKIYNILGTKGRDPGILNQAEAFGNKSLELSPQRQETLYYLARTALLKNNASLAVTLAKQAVSADPDIKQSHWYLGLAYIANNQKGDGINEIKKAIEMGYKPQNQTEENFLKNLGL